MRERYIPRSIPGITLLLATGLAGRGVDFDKMDHDAYVAGCAKLGIDESSPDFNQCMTQQRRLQAMSDEDFLNREALRDSKK